MTWLLSPRRHIATPTREHHASSHAISGISDPEGFARQRWPTSRVFLMDTWSTVIDHVAQLHRATTLSGWRWSYRNPKIPFQIIENPGFRCSPVGSFSRKSEFAVSRKAIWAGKVVQKKRFTSGAVTIYTCAGMRDRCEQCNGPPERWVSRGVFSERNFERLQRLARR